MTLEEYHERSELWVQKYRNAIKHGKICVKKTRGIISAFNTNVDAIVRVSDYIKFLEDELSKLFLLEQVQEGLKTPPGIINTVSDFLVGLLRCMQTGTGAEWLIQNQDVFTWLQENFQPTVLTLGGQAGLVGNALAALGMTKVYLHASSRSPLQIETLPNFGVLIPVKNGHIVFKSPKEAVNPRDETYIHWIFEFLDGTEIRMGNEGSVTAPEDNRFIATFDMPNMSLEINPDFIEGIKSRINEIDKAMLSGFHLLRHHYPDGTTYMDRLQPAYKQIMEWKKLNPKIRIHIEQGSMQDAVIRKEVLKTILPHIDAFGINEDELVEILDAFEISEAFKELKKEYSAINIFSGARRIFELFTIPRMTVHTRNFSLTLLRPQYGVTTHTEQHAMLLGAMTAAMRANTGKFSSLDEIDQYLQSKKFQEERDNEHIKISKYGLEQHDALAQKIDRISLTSQEEFLQTGIASFSDFYTIFTISLIVEDPKAIVGLGDSFTAGLLLGEYIEQQEGPILNYSSL